MGKNKRSTTNNKSEFDEDYFDDSRQERSEDGKLAENGEKINAQ